MADQFGCVETLTKDDDRYRRYHKSALKSVQDVVDLFDHSFESKTGWKLESDRSEINTKSWSRSWNKGKLFAVETVFEETAEDVNNELWHNYIEAVEWDPTLSERQILFPVGSQTEIVYQLMADMPIISGRDFVGVRTWRKVNDSYIQAGQSVEAEEMPPRKGKVRAVSHLTAIKLTNIGPKRCKVEDLSCLDMKGFVPKMAVNAMLSNELISQLDLLRRHMNGTL